MKKIINKYLLLFLCIFSLVLPTGCEVKEQKQVVVDYQDANFLRGEKAYYLGDFKNALTFFRYKSEMLK